MARWKGWWKWRRKIKDKEGWGVGGSITPTRWKTVHGNCLWQRAMWQRLETRNPWQIPEHCCHDQIPEHCCLDKVPEEASLSVVKGAVAFGHDPSAICQRICRFTYGVGSYLPFVEGQHREDLRVNSDGMDLCKVSLRLYPYSLYCHLYKISLRLYRYSLCCHLFKVCAAIPFFYLLYHHLHPGEKKMYSNNFVAKHLWTDDYSSVLCLPLAPWCNATRIRVIFLFFSSFFFFVLVFQKGFCTCAFERFDRATYWNEWTTMWPSR